MLEEIKELFRDQIKKHDRILRLMREKSNMRADISFKGDQIQKLKKSLDKAERSVKAKQKRIAKISKKSRALQDDVEKLHTECENSRVRIIELQSETAKWREISEKLKSEQPAVHAKLIAEADGTWSYYCKVAKSPDKISRTSPVKPDLITYMLKAIGHRNVTASQAMSVFFDAMEVVNINVKQSPNPSYPGLLFSDGIS